MAYTVKDAAGNTIYMDGAGTGADSGNAITPNSTLIGATNEAAAAADNSTSGLNGLLKRIAQRLTSLIALLPSSIGQKAKTGSLSVTLASDQDALPITDNSGSITVDGMVSVTAGANNIGDVDIAPKTLAYVSGTAASSGDNTLISAPGSGSIYISTIFVQNTTTTATTCLLKDGTTEIFRMLAQNQGDGVRLQFPAGREMKLSATTALKLNLSGANTHNYSVVYFTE